MTRTVLQLTAVTALSAAAAAGQIITTVAGTDYTFDPNGSVATAIALGQPMSVAADAQKNVYVAGGFDNTILRIAANGTVTTFAGNGFAGFSGDGGPAISAALSTPMALAADSVGNIFFIDFLNFRVRKISADGTISTVAGNGNPGYSGDGGPATAASFNDPTGIAVDNNGNLFIADRQNNVVRRVDSTGIVATVAGGGPVGPLGDGGPAVGAYIDGPSAVAVGPDGGLYIFDRGNGRIRKVAQGTISTIAGSGSAICSAGGVPATAAGLGQGYYVSSGGLAFSPQGQLYISLACNGPGGIPSVAMGEVLTIAGNGTLTLVAGNGTHGFSGDGGPAAGAELGFGEFSGDGIAFDTAGNLYIADTFNNRIREVNPAGIISTYAGDGSVRARADGVQAQLGFLYSPQRIAFDVQHNLLIADAGNNCIRRVDPSGIITTIAGTGLNGYAGDGGPAGLASLSSPKAIAVDTAGNIYIGDTGNNAIRKIDSSGAISTVVGPENGPPGHTGLGLSEIEDLALDHAGNLYVADDGNNRVLRVTPAGAISVFAGNGSITPFGAGDGGPAVNATIDPEGLAFDQAGNLLIADVDAYRVRKVDSTGTITTIAGTGASTFSGDGGPALQAGFGGFLRSVFVDSSGRIYTASDDNRVRRIDTSGIISTLAGSGIEGFSGDGGSPQAAALSLANCDTGIAEGAAGDILISDCGNNRVREVPASLPFAPAVATGNSVSLTHSSGGKPVTAALTIRATLTAGSSVAIPGMLYSIAVTAGGSWLSVAPQSGNTPGLITVTANPLNLGPGVYEGTIAIAVPLASPPNQTVGVQFTVTAPIPPTVSLDQSHVSFTYATTSTARSQTLIVSNSGGGSLGFMTSIILDSGGSANWLSVAPSSGSALPGSPVSLAVTADPSKLGPGTYTANLTVNGGAAGSVTIPVTMTISANALVMLLSQAGLTFTGIQNGGVIPPQTFGVLNLGSGTLKWTVETSTLSGGDWLNATPSTGASIAAPPDGVPLVSVVVNPAGLAPGVYYGLVKAISPGAANTPQEVVAVLQVLPAGTDLAPVVQPASLLFSAPAGISSPSSQTVSVYDPTGTEKGFRSGVVTSAGGNWLEILPTDATIVADEPVDVVVQPVVNGLPPGTYTGTITFQFSDGRVSAVGVTFVVIGASAPTSENPHTIPHDSGSCTPSKLSPVLTTLGPGFVVPAGYPEGLTVQIADDCGNPLTQGQVSMEFSTGQGLKYMQSLNNGRWDVTWDTGSQQNSSVTLTVHAVHPTLPIKGDTQITGALGGLQPPPQVNDRGVVSAASFTATPVAPGGFISIFGSLLSDATSSAPVLPLPTMLNNTTVKLGDQTLPLFYTNNGSMGQLNALVPYETPLNTNLQLLVQRDNTYATPVYVDVAAAQPGILEYDTTEAVAVDLKGNLIGPLNPAHAGDLLTMYCLGLGAVSPAVADGAAAPVNPPASTMNMVTVMVGGQTANVYFAGLTPTLAGLYQINFYVPQNAGTGDQVPVVVSTAGQTSLAVNLSVR